MEKINGKSLDTYLQSDVNTYKLVDKMAEKLAELHQINPKALSNFNSLHEQYKFRQNKLLNLEHFINKFGQVPFFYMPSQRQFVSVVKKLGKVNLKSYPLALLHLDYEPNHVILSGDELVLVDWGEALVGDPSFDVAWAYHKLRIGRDFSKVDLGEHFVKCYEKHSGHSPVNLDVYKMLVPLEMAVWAGLSPFTGKVPSDYYRLLDLTCGNIFGIFSGKVYRKRLSERMATHHTKIWSNINYIQNYAIHYLEKVVS
jgi:thiamine kinase-like enzyme